MYVCELRQFYANFCTIQLSYIVSLQPVRISKTMTGKNLIELLTIALFHFLVCLSLAFYFKFKCHNLFTLTSNCGQNNRWHDPKIWGHIIKVASPIFQQNYLKNEVTFSHGKRNREVVNRKAKRVLSAEVSPVVTACYIPLLDKSYKVLK